MPTVRFSHRAATRGSLLVLAAATLAAPVAFAQRTVPFQMGIPVAPQGLAHRPLGDGPFDYATGEGQDIRVVVVTKALSYPFSMTWLPDGTLLVAQRNGELRTIKNGKLDAKPVSGGPLWNCCWCCRMSIGCRWTTWWERLKKAIHGCGSNRVGSRAGP